MAKVARAKVKDKWKGKMWYRLHAPSMFNYAIMAHTPADSPEVVNGRVTEVPLEQLTGDFNQKNFMIYGCVFIKPAQPLLLFVMD